VPEEAVFYGSWPNIWCHCKIRPLLWHHQKIS
jgi:hypothetical protein